MISRALWESKTSQLLCQDLELGTWAMVISVLQIYIIMYVGKITVKTLGQGRQYKAGLADLTLIKIMDQIVI